VIANSAPVIAANVRVFSGAAPQNVLRELAIEFERATGHRVEFTFRLVSEIQQKLAAGDKADLILLPIPLLAATEKIVPLRPEGRVPLARLAAGVIIARDTPSPDISTPETLSKVLLDARAIVWDDARTPLGAHLDRMADQLGIADQLRSKVTRTAPIDGGADMVAKGDAEIGLFLISEVQERGDTKLVGPLPSALQFRIAYGAGIPAYNDGPEPARAFVTFVTDPRHAERWTRGGFLSAAGM
jgi:molybdate transport system substrate-binding protein